MCGIYGVLGTGIIKTDLSVLYTLGFVNMMRGLHSTGVMRAWHHKNRPVEIMKDTVPAITFFNDKDYRKILEDCSPVAIMCHNRHATVGNADNIEGAHPFATERYVGFHNGTLREDKYTKDSEFFTDSEALWNEIQANGFEDTLTKLYADSAFALAYYDKETGKVGFIRNDKRPLAFAVHNTRNVVYYSSDLEDLRYALNKAGIDYSDYTLGSWQHIRTDPRNLTFRVTDEKLKERTNLWNIDRYEPKPESPPVVPRADNLLEFRAPYGSGTTTYRTNNPLTCKVCTDELHWARAGQSKGLNPKYVKNFGNICHKCVAMLEDNYEIDLDDDDADAWIGAAGIMAQPLTKTVN